VTKPAATLIAMAAVMLSAGCGGGSTNKSTGTKLQAGPVQIVAKEREFRTVIPRGYTNHPSVAQYWAIGPEEDGFPTSVLVVRQAVSKEVSIGTFAHRALSAIRQSARKVSRLQPISVNGEPGFAVDYLVTATGSLKGKVTHVRQVLVKHGPWVIFIRDIALPAQYEASLGAMDEVLRNWQWL
jgi:hypothetical protein